MARFWGLFLLSLLVGSGLAVAQPDALAWSTQVDYEFGQTMRFHLTAENPDPIQSATLFIRTPEFSRAFSVTQAVAPSRQIVVDYALDLSQVRLAPFAIVTYWWVLETAVTDIPLPEKTMLYEDDQFVWRQIEDEGVIAHWTGEESTLGQLTLDIVSASLSELSDLIPTADDMTLDVYVYPSSADLRAALQLTGRDWVGGHAHPELGVILVTAVNARTAATDLGQSIPHELAHLLLYQAAGSHHETVPIWFHEGMATLAESTSNPTYKTVLETAVANQTTIPFSELCTGFPPEEDRALLAYAQSASLIQYIQAQHGSHTLNELVAAFADGADCQSGVSRVLNKSLDTLTQDWLQQQQPNPPLVRFWLENSLWLLLLLAGFGMTSLLILTPKNRKL